MEICKQNILLIHIVVLLFPENAKMIMNHKHIVPKKSRIKYCVKLPNVIVLYGKKKTKRKKFCDTIDSKTKGDSIICYKFLFQYKK